ncbi:DNA-directed RNA polymerase, M/15kDa subunit [Ophiocordyceps camponoti-floridani]|uniref:DNA-directed RNA polymerase, M/15kDa subunit n=1 Tax=Ophiocordyceps camponoti-floridani TaxID=2030778 RepID=A0A8H4Q0N5_9HYPO|nr:DNA-directed RNA polymerase, M/15kDa subunit [Ophiocordyceps camponoti-floridani]
MATPQSTTSQDEGSGARKLEQITFRFCSECSNMLYPKEDKDAHSLQFTCRTCQYTEEASSSCVFRNVLNNSAGETAGVTQDVGSDPTCTMPAAYLSIVKREDKRDEDSDFANFVLPGGIDYYTEYDDYLENDDYEEATAASVDANVPVDVGFRSRFDKALRDVMIRRGNASVPAHL